MDVEIDALDLAGDGVARVHGRTVAVPFTLPGERVRLASASAAGTAHLIEVLRGSPHRVVPRCPHFGPPAAEGGGGCGGCRWQHIAYPEQLRLKSALVARLIASAVTSAHDPAPTVSGTSIEHPWESRQKVHFVFGAAQGRRQGPRQPWRLVMGHYARGNALALAMRDACVDARVPAGAISSVARRPRDGERLLTVVVPDASHRGLRRATERAVAADPPSGVHLNLRHAPDAFIFGRETRRLRGAGRLREDVAGTSFLISPTAFFQTNVAAAERLVRLVGDAVPSGAQVLDLYAGAGLFALPLARAGHSVTAVEENREAVADGQASLRLNRIDPDACRFLARPVEAALRRQGTVDTVILDPPREGASAAVLNRVFGALRPASAVYVSCNAATLGRDLRRIAGHGYRLERVQPLDMFPHTPHVETVLVLPAVPETRSNITSVRRHALRSRSPVHPRLYFV